MDQWQIGQLVILYVQSVLFVLVYTLIQILTATFVESKLDIIMIKLFHTIIFPKWSLFWSQIFIASLHTYIHVSSPLPVNSDILCDNNISGCIAFGSSYHSNIIFNPELWDS